MTMCHAANLPICQSDLHVFETLQYSELIEVAKQRVQTLINSLLILNTIITWFLVCLFKLILNL